MVPGPKRRAQPVGQAAGGAAAGVMAVAVDVHLQVWCADLEHSREVLIRPDRMNLVAGTGAGDERGWHITRDCRRGATSERRRTGVDDPTKSGLELIPARGSPASLLLTKSSK